MSKKQKTIRAQKRKQAKRAEKATRKAQYEAMRDSRQNQKSKNKLRSEGKSLVKNVTHPSGKCHNIGCYACSPAEYNTPSSTQLVRLIIGPGLGITTDKVQSLKKIFSPKRQLTRAWGT